MSGLLWLLLCAAGAAYGVWTSHRCRAPAWAAWTATFLWAVAGVSAVLAHWVAGDGIVLPGLQLSPGLKAHYFATVAAGERVWIDRLPVLLAPFAHLVLLALRRDRATLLYPLPATALFVWLFLQVGAETDETTVRVVQARGPDKVAYLTIVSRPEGAHLVFAAGEPFAGFLSVVHEQDTDGEPPELHLHWTKDGEALVLRVHEVAYPSFAVDLDGNVTGLLPVAAREWPKPGVSAPPDVERRFSEARKDVAVYVTEHGGLYPP